MDDGSLGLREKWEREGENEREGGKWGEMKPGCFCRPFRNSNFFFFFILGDVEGATSARDGRWTDAKNYSNNYELFELFFAICYY
jgi:hypothetical protein